MTGENLLPVPNVQPTDPPFVRVCFNSEYLPMLLNAIEDFNNWYNFDSSRAAAVDEQLKIDALLETFMEAVDAAESGRKMPVGAVIMFDGDVIPDGWLECDGSTYLESAYPELYAVTRTAKRTTQGGQPAFIVPDMKSRVSVGYNATGGGGLSQRLQGATGGAETHVLTVSELATHTHVQNSHNHTQNAHTHIQDAHTHVQNSHNHTQNSHNHTQNPHNHTQDAHNHTQTAHTHVQNSHTHTQASHTHTVNEALHDHPIATVGGNAGAFAGYYYGNFENLADQQTFNNTVGISLNLATPTINGQTATNQNTTAQNNASTAVNNEETATNNAVTATNNAVTATNQNATATNQNATATNNATQATNQDTGNSSAHNNVQPFYVLRYLICASSEAC